MEVLQSFMKRYTFIFLYSSLFASVPYNVAFVGIEEPEIEVSLRKTSELVLLQKRPPPSPRALQYRIASDIPNMLRVLEAYGYYDAHIYWEIQKEQQPVLVEIAISPRFRYTIGPFSLAYVAPKDKPELPLDKWGIRAGKPFRSEEILALPQKILRFLADHHYPLACVRKTSYALNPQDKTLSGFLEVQSGPKTRFGPLIIEGTKSVHPDFISRRIAFEEGEWYDERLVASSQKTLMETGLFSSVFFSHQEELEEGELPVHLTLSEAKHKTISIGLSYATLDGPGGALEWENRNIGGQGQTAAFDLNLSSVYSAGSLSYSVPDFFRMQQTYLAQGAFSREDVTVYTARTYAGLQRVEAQYGKHLFAAQGMGYEYIKIDNSISNGSYSFVHLNGIARYQKVNHVLQPSRGFSILYKLAPYLGVSANSGSF